MSHFYMHNVAESTVQAIWLVDLMVSPLSRLSDAILLHNFIPGRYLDLACLLASGRVMQFMVSDNHLNTFSMC